MHSKVILGLLLLVLSISKATTSSYADNVERLEVLCKELGKSLIAAEVGKEWNSWGAQGTVSHFSYSLEIDACVGTEINYLNNEWSIRDVQNRFIDHGALFWCDNSGIDNVILEAVRRLKGKVFNESYRKYLDNGEGGAARAVYTPPTSYSRDKCEAMFKKKIRELRLVNNP